MRKLFLLTLCALCGALAACEDAAERVLSITATGDLHGSAFLDRDGDGRRTGVDSVFRGLRVAILPHNGGSAVANVQTDSLGRFQARRLPVGSYRITADPASAGDSVHVERIDSALVTLAANDTVESVIVLGYNTPSLRQISALPRGSRVAIFATALNGWNSFGDSTVHFADSTGAIRAVAVAPASIGTGDKIRATATVGDHQGRPALLGLTVVSRLAGEVPLPSELSTAAAAQAGGALDAALVRVRAATVLNASSLTGGDILFTVDDGSGVLEVLIDGNAGISMNLEVRPGAQLNVTGLLVPRTDGSGRWRLKPRASADLTVDYPALPIATVRTRQPGQLVRINGIVVNAIDTWEDKAVHIVDASGAMRVMTPSGFFAAGDSVTVLGTTAIANGQPILTSAGVAVFARRTVPPPFELSTLRASNGDNGQRDAALVRITNALVDSVAGGARRLNDGSGPVDLVPPLLFALPAVGSRVDLTGVLVPNASGRWVIRPRSAADLSTR